MIPRSCVQSIPCSLRSSGLVAPIVPPDKSSFTHTWAARPITRKNYLTAWYKAQGVSGTTLTATILEPPRHEQADLLVTTPVSDLLSHCVCSNRGSHSFRTY